MDSEARVGHLQSDAHSTVLGDLSRRSRGVSSRGGLADWQIRRLISFIDESPSKRVCTTDLAARAGVSESHLFRAFRRTFGESPMRFVTRSRIRHAQALMRIPENSLSDIALVCGFCDQSHFTRSFRRLLGMSPSQWRCRFLEGRSA